VHPLSPGLSSDGQSFNWGSDCADIAQRSHSFDHICGWNCETCCAMLGRGLQPAACSEDNETSLRGEACYSEVLAHRLEAMPQGDVEAINCSMPKRFTMKADERKATLAIPHQGRNASMDVLPRRCYSFEPPPVCRLDESKTAVARHYSSFVPTPVRNASTPRLGPPRSSRSASSLLKVQRVHVCPAGHTLTPFRSSMYGYICNVCAENIPKGTILSACRQCDFDKCRKCSLQACSEKIQQAKPVSHSSARNIFGQKPQVEQLNPVAMHFVSSVQLPHRTENLGQV